MSEHLHAVVSNNKIQNVIVISPEAAQQFTTLRVYGDANLIDLDGADPTPGIGWRRVGTGWAPPEASEAAPTAAPREEETMTGVVKTVDPLTVTLVGYGDQPAQRHGGYTPMVGDKVQVTYAGGHWIIADKVM